MAVRKMPVSFLMLLALTLVSSKVIDDFEAHLLSSRQKSMRDAAIEDANSDDDFDLDDLPTYDNSTGSEETHFNAGDMSNLIPLDDDKAPTFTWDSSYKAGDDMVKMTIGNLKDLPDMVAVLNKSNPIENDDEHMAPVDECIYFGHFESDPDVSVAINGCPGSNNFDIAFHCDPLEYSVFEVVDGKVYAVKSPESTRPNSMTRDTDEIELHSDDEQANEFVNLGRKRHYGGHGGYGWYRPPPPSPIEPQLLQANVVLNFDTELFNEYKIQTLNKMRQILNLSKVMFNWVNSLGTRIFLNVKHQHSINASLTVYHMRRVASFTSRSHPHDGDLFLYFSKLTFGSRMGAVAGVGTTCSRHKGLRSAIIEVDTFRSNGFAAEVLSHEIGHLIGMKHDFKWRYGSYLRPRYSSNGTICSNQGGVMDYFQPSINKWSDCSREDFARYYNNIERSYGGFCLATGCGKVGTFCNLLNSTATYNCDHWYFKEYCRTACNTCF